MKSEYICISCRNNKQDEKIKRFIEAGYGINHFRCSCGNYLVYHIDVLEKSFAEKWAEIKKEWLNKK